MFESLNNESVIFTCIQNGENEIVVIKEAVDALLFGYNEPYLSVKQ